MYEQCKTAIQTNPFKMDHHECLLQGNFNFAIALALIMSYTLLKKNSKFV